AGRQPRSPTGSASTSHDPPASGCSTPAPGSATSDPEGRPPPFQVLPPPLLNLAVSNVSPPSNALYDRCATEHRHPSRPRETGEHAGQGRRRLRNIGGTRRPPRWPAMTMKQLGLRLRTAFPLVR